MVVVVGQAFAGAREVLTYLRTQDVGARLKCAEAISPRLEAMWNEGLDDSTRFVRIVDLYGAALPRTC